MSSEFVSFFAFTAGYLTGSEDYYTHERACGMPAFAACKQWHGLDLYENEQPTWDYNQNYSTFLFVDKAKAVISAHDKMKVGIHTLTINLVPKDFPFL